LAGFAELTFIKEFHARHVKKNIIINFIKKENIIEDSELR